MPIDPVHAGRVFPPTDPVTVSHESVDAFNASVGFAADLPGTAAPTYPFTLAVRAWQAMFDADDLDIELSRLVHADQRFTVARPLAVGDELIAQATLTSVRPAPGSDRLVVDTEVRTATGEHLALCTSTLLCSYPVDEPGQGA